MYARKGLPLKLFLFGGLSIIASAENLFADDRCLLLDYRRPTEIPYPDYNPYSKAKADLGRMLFHDTIMSGGRTMSCATCHVANLAWGDGRPRAIGEAKAAMSFRTPTLLNVAWVSPLGWTGKFRNLEAVAFTPITSTMNMNLPEPVLIERLKAVPDYVQRFAEAFDDGAISQKNIEKALATYERTIVSSEAPFDLWVKGEDDAISASAKRGFHLFNTKAHCSECHSGWAFTDSSFHDIGSAQGDDIGRGAIFKTSVKLRYAFKTPTLRDVALRAPYMHDGSVATIEEVIELYNRGGIDRPSRSESIKPLGLTQEEKDDLIAFLKTLTSPSQIAENPIPAK
jgi:cytochrome c peroxidase